MSCGCAKQTEYHIALESAKNESKHDKSDYVIYEFEGKIHYDRKTCWQKDGKRGKVKEFIYYTQ